MRAELVVITRITLGNEVQVSQAKTDELVERFSLAIADPRLTIRIGLQRRLHPMQTLVMVSFASFIPSILATASNSPS